MNIQEIQALISEIIWFVLTIAGMLLAYKSLTSINGTFSISLNKKGIYFDLSKNKD